MLENQKEKQMETNQELEKLFYELLERLYDGDWNDQMIYEALTKAYLIGTDQ